MKKLLLIFCFVFSLSPVWAQKINADSLLNVVIARNRNTKVPAPTSLDSLIKGFSVTRDPVARTGFLEEIIIGDQEVSAKHMAFVANKLLALAQKEKDEAREALALTILGYTTYNSGDNAGGQKMMFSGLKHAKNKGDNAAIGVIDNLLGVCTTNKSSGKPYYQKALQFSRAGGDSLSVGFELGNFYYVYSYEHKADSALYYVLKSLELAVNRNYEVIIQNDLINLGNLKSEPDVKLKCYRAALNMPYTRNSPEGMQRAAFAIASYFQASKQVDSALYYAKKAFKVSDSLLIGRKQRPARLLAQLYRGRNADSALKYTEISYALRDSMFNLDRIEHAHAISLAEQQKQEEIDAQKAADQANLRLYVLIVVMAFLLLLAFVFWRNNRQKQKANLLLNEQKEEIATQRDNLGQALEELKTTQAQLVQREKMASLGELTAGVAHEIQNPLNFVNNFSEVNTEMIDELEIELKAGNIEDALAIAADIRQNEVKINHHGKRADSIVRGMLEHSRTSTGERILTNINALADEFLKLSYQGLRAKDKDFNTELVTNFDKALPKIEIVQQDIGRVLLNLYNNAFYAVNQKKKADEPGYKPEVAVSTSVEKNSLIIKVKDNGNGIPDAIKDKIMQPFFTTKPTGEGTGLGLSLSYDIVVKGRGGSITVDTREGEYTEFIVNLPKT